MASVLMEMICGTPIPAEHPVDVAPFEGTLTHEEDPGRAGSGARMLALYTMRSVLKQSLSCRVQVGRRQQIP